MATKKDLATMATKGDVRAIVRDEPKPIRSDLKSIRDELDDLTEKKTSPTFARKSITRSSASPRSNATSASPKESPPNPTSISHHTSVFRFNVSSGLFKTCQKVKKIGGKCSLQSIIIPRAERFPHSVLEGSAQGVSVV